MTAPELLATLQDQGVTLVAVGGRLRYRPSSAVTLDQRQLLTALKPELLEVLRQSAATCGGNSVSSYYKPDKPDIESTSGVEPHDDPTIPTDPCACHNRWRLVLENWQPLAGPISSQGSCMTITDPARCVKRSVEELLITVEHLNEGRDSAFTELVDERIGWLRACGLVVSLQHVVDDQRRPATVAPGPG